MWRYSSLDGCGLVAFAVFIHAQWGLIVPSGNISNIFSCSFSYQRSPKRVKLNSIILSSDDEQLSWLEVLQKQGSSLGLVHVCGPEQRTGTILRTEISLFRTPKCQLTHRELKKVHVITCQVYIFASVFSLFFAFKSHPSATNANDLIYREAELMRGSKSCHLDVVVRKRPHLAYFSRFSLPSRYSEPLTVAQSLYLLCSRIT